MAQLPDENVFGDYGEWPGRDVLDAGGERLGGVREIYLDRETGRPEWVLVEVDGDEPRFVPLADAAVESQAIRIAHAAAVVRGAPSIGHEPRIDQGQERELYAHYGLGYSEDESGSGLPADPEPADGLSAQALSEGTPPATEVVVDETREHAAAAPAAEEPLPDVAAADLVPPADEPPPLDVAAEPLPDVAAADLVPPADEPLPLDVAAEPLPDVAAADLVPPADEPPPLDVAGADLVPPADEPPPLDVAAEAPGREEPTTILDVIAEAPVERPLPPAPVIDEPAPPPPVIESPAPAEPAVDEPAPPAPVTAGPNLGAADPPPGAADFTPPPPPAPAGRSFPLAGAAALGAAALFVLLRKLRG
jgi:PRC-barrel domain